ncbi:hypothetical protein [Pararhodonellum marinum]|uniref:hypothetical protein n=1 Tax=Pararhodonellum marinum TaxID=2755358 RepID=UPI00188EEE8E|nr:hypothetical protein [Pararhodonellum marinum]
MENKTIEKPLKDKLLHELAEYGFNVLYLGLFFSVFILYRRLLLAEYGIYLNDYFIGLVKALIFGKVIMIGTFLKISKRFENQPLIVPTLYKTLFFTLLVVVFELLEVTVKTLWKTESWTGITDSFTHHFNMVWFGGVLIVAFTFLPFFAFKELSRHYGVDSMRNLFLKKSENPLSN